MPMDLFRDVLMMKSGDSDGMILPFGNSGYCFLNWSRIFLSSIFLSWFRVFYLE